MNHQDKDTPFHLAGWVLFLLCAFLFLYVAVRDGDIILAIASLVFLGGCVTFLIPLLFRGRWKEKVTGHDQDKPPVENG
jgi:hypothetical protein